MTVRVVGLGLIFLNCVLFLRFGPSMTPDYPWLSPVVWLDTLPPAQMRICGPRLVVAARGHVSHSWGVN